MINKENLNNNIILKALIVLSLSLINNFCYSQGVTLSSNNWRIPVTPGVITAGEDYDTNKEYVSTIDQFKLNFILPAIILVLYKGKIMVSANHQTIDPNLSLSIKRNSRGSNILLCVLCTLTGTENYLSLNNSPTELFNLSIPVGVTLSSINNIDLQLKLKGISVTTPTTTPIRVTFTVQPN